MLGFRTLYLGPGACLAPGMAHAGEGVKSFHEGEGAVCGAPTRQQLARGTEWREIRAGARAVLEEHAFGLGEGEDRLHPVLDLVDEARRQLGGLLDAGVEPDRTVEGGFLMQQEMRQLLPQDCR